MPPLMRESLNKGPQLLLGPLIYEVTKPCPSDFPDLKHAKIERYEIHTLTA